jgi:phage gp46-like protein
MLVTIALVRHIHLSNSLVKQASGRMWVLKRTKSVSLVLTTLTLRKTVASSALLVIIAQTQPCLIQLLARKVTTVQLELVF